MSRVSFAALLVLALAQMFAVAFDLPIVRALAAASVASPAPKVFTSDKGLEAFSSTHEITRVDVDGQTHAMRIGPHSTARLSGPYNRRNPYGAVLVFAPLLSTHEATRPMFESVARYALCGDAPLLRELDLSSERGAASFTILHLPRPGTHTALPLHTEVVCR